MRSYVRACVRVLRRLREELEYKTMTISGSPAYMPIEQAHTHTHTHTSYMPIEQVAIGLRV
jgi:hypothetical protein